MLKRTAFVLILVLTLSACNLPLTSADPTPTPGGSGAGAVDASTSGDAPARAITPAIGAPEGGSPSGTCPVGAWQTDPVQYAEFMNAIISTSSLEILAVDRSLVLIFNADYTFEERIPDVTINAMMSITSGSTTSDSLDMVLTGTALGTWAYGTNINTLVFTSGAGSNVAVTSIAINGESLGGSPIDMSDLMDLSAYTEVGFLCSGDTLTLTPHVEGMPEAPMILYRIP